jgi:hypothetical protein
MYQAGQQKARKNQNVKPGSVRIRVASTTFEAALQEIKKLAKKVESESTNGNDVTQEYYDQTARLENNGIAGFPEAGSRLITVAIASMPVFVLVLVTKRYRRASKSTRNADNINDEGRQPNERSWPLLRATTGNTTL